MDDFEQLDYYQLLEISRSASADEIKQAYRQQMRRYHPDRAAASAPAEQEYASRRALRINEAYQTLSDFSARAAYNRNLGARGAPAPRPQPAPVKPRDHQAELYEQARAHLDAGRALQAAATLRELQRLNPFYRDSAALLAQAEAALAHKLAPAPKSPPPAPARPAPNSSRRQLLVGGVGSVLLAAAGVAAWWLRRATATATSPAVEAPTAAALGVAPTVAPMTPTDLPTSAPPTAAPTEPAPTEPAPTAAPTEVPPTPVAEEEGRLLNPEQFPDDAWPSTTGNGWSVAAGDGVYTITTDPGLGNIWAYRTSPAGEDLLIGVDVEVRGGEAGLILRFSDANNYLAFFIDPIARTFRLEQHVAGQISTPVANSHPAIKAGASAINRLAARLVGNRVGLRVNGQPLADLSLAAPPTSSRYGLVAVAADGPATARFYNLTLRDVA